MREEACMKKLLCHLIAEIFVAGILFIVFLPFMFLMMKPNEDLLYHTCRKAPLRLRPADCSGHLVNNSYIAVTGSIDHESFSQRHHFGNTTFLFRLKDYPSDLLVHVRSGGNFEKLIKACNDKKPESLETALDSQYTFEGRLYHSDNPIGSAFEHYNYLKEIDFHGYLNKVLKDTRPDRSLWSAKLDGSSQTPGRVAYWLLADCEKPSLEALWSSNFAVFIFGIALGIAGIVIAVAYSKKSRSGGRA